MEYENPTFLTCFKSKTYKNNHFYQSKYYNTIFYLYLCNTKTTNRLILSFSDYNYVIYKT